MNFLAADFTFYLTYKSSDCVSVTEADMIYLVIV